eukprot:g6909.t1
MRTNPSAQAARQAAAHLNSAQSLPTPEKDRVKALIADGKLAEVGREILAKEWRSSSPRAAPLAGSGGPQAMDDGEDDEEAALAAALAMSMGTLGNAAPPALVGAAGASAANDAAGAGAATVAAAAVTGPPEEKKKKKKKKKKKGGYAAMMADVMAPAKLQRTISAERRGQSAKIAKSTGGGHFSKLDKI